MRVRALTEKDAKEVCGWRYPPPYDVYDHPDFDEAAAKRWAIADPTARSEQFRSVTDHGRLVGFSRLFQRDGRWLLGVGMAPQMTSQGLGHEFVGVVLADVRSRHSGPIELEVRSFNRRALAAYRRHGFEETGRRTIDVPAGPVEVIVMSDKGARPPADNLEKTPPRDALSR